MSDYEPISIIREKNIVQAIHVKQKSTNKDYREEIYTEQVKNEIKQCILERSNIKISPELVTPITIIEEFYVYLVKPYYSKRITDMTSFNNGRLNKISLTYWMDIAASINELHKNRIYHKNLTIESYFINSEDHLVLNDITPLNRFIIDKGYDIIYTSPEESNGEVKSFESDMWSIGIIIYTLIFNTPPFQTLNDLISYTRNEYKINYQGLDKPLVNILNGLLNVNKEKRLKSSELVDQLSIVPQLSNSSLLSPKSLPQSSSTSEDEYPEEDLYDNDSPSPINNNDSYNDYDYEDPPVSVESDNSLHSILFKNDYELLDEIGKGPIGVVYKAKNERYPNVPLAIKVIKSDDIDEINMSLLVSLNNKMENSCIQIIESYVDSDQMFIVTKQYSLNMQMYLDNQRSKNILFAEDSICDNFNQLLETLQLIHYTRRPHMDIKLNNLFMNDINRKWLYCDSFILSLYDSVEEKQMLYTCNINYIAPEVLEGKKYNLKCDCWSLGCILYEILTLTQAFPETPIDNIPYFDGIYKDYDIMFKIVVVGLLDRDPEKRLSVDDALSIMEKGRSLS